MKVTDITSFSGEHHFLSNFYPCRVGYECVWYDSVEHAYQAAKWPVEQRGQFRQGITAAQAKRLGKQAQLPSDWHQRKYSTMRDLVSQKFLNNPDLSALLLATGTAHLIEGNQWGDTYWGVCHGFGSNYLGLILMEVRYTIINRQRLQYFFLEEHPGE